MRAELLSARKMGPAKKFNIAVLGAAGGIGQPLSLLLKMNPHVHGLCLFDVMPSVAGVALDLSHIDTPVIVKGFVGDKHDKEKQRNSLAQTLQGADITIIAAGVHQKPGMSREDLFDKNAGIAAGLISAIAENCPQCMTCVITNPINSMLPIAADILRSKGVYDPKRLFGVSALDCMRMRTFLSEMLEKKSTDIDAEVIGGHSDDTILPLLSSYSENIQEERLKSLYRRIQTAADEIIVAKAGEGSSTLSVAYVSALFLTSLMKAMGGEPNIVECAYVPSDLYSECPFFASKVTLGEHGIEKVHGPSQLSEYERSLLENTVIPNLRKAIFRGCEFGCDFVKRSA